MGARIANLVNFGRCSMKSYKDLKDEIAVLNKKAEAARLKEMDAAIAQAKELIATYGLSAAQLGLELTGKRLGKGKRQASPAKYKDPVSGKTWNGVGKRPKWIVDAKGDMNKFLIGGAAGSTASAVAPVESQPKKKVTPKAKPAAKKVAAAGAPAAEKSKAAAAKKPVAAKSEAKKAPVKKAAAAKKPAVKKTAMKSAAAPTTAAN